MTAWLGFTYVLPRLPALDLSAIILLHPIISMIWAWWILDESLSGAQLTGAALVVVAVALVGARPRTEPTRVPDARQWADHQARRDNLLYRITIRSRGVPVGTCGRVPTRKVHRV